MSNKIIGNIYENIPAKTKFKVIGQLPNGEYRLVMLVPPLKKTYVFTYSELLNTDLWHLIETPPMYER